jgi:hypothetical protein
MLERNVIAKDILIGLIRDKPLYIFSGDSIDVYIKTAFSVADRFIEESNKVIK